MAEVAEWNVSRDTFPTKEALLVIASALLTAFTVGLLGKTARQFDQFRYNFVYELRRWVR